MARTKSGDGQPAAGLSVVVPLFNEAANLPGLHARLTALAAMLARKRALKTEIVYVDDGSWDRTLAIARGLPAAAADVQVLSLSRNFGKEAALAAGLDHARFGAVLFMDGDGQHAPELAEKLVALWQDENYDVIYTAKSHRQSEGAARRLSIRLFYRLLNLGARHPIPEDASDFRLLSPRAAAALRALPERNRFFKGLSSWIGFRQVRVPYEPEVRAHGRSTWHLRHLVGLSIEGLTAFSTAPLRIASLFGLLLAASALFLGAWTLMETFVYGKDVPGFPSLMVGMMVIGGVQLLMIGVMGEYIAKILSELKARPVYFVAEQELKEAQAEKSNAARGKRGAKA
ncbi:MAG TPA: glycosyltransferase family 2 protein [Xanthobacteraceae bacterium]|nr:glycosyltransferase family 2 protein [Xanthobacteraceae bacterium]